MNDPIPPIHSLSRQPHSMLLRNHSFLRPRRSLNRLVSLEEVRGILAGLSDQGHTAKVRELIVAAGADKHSAVDPAKFGWLLERAKEIADGTV